MKGRASALLLAGALAATAAGGFFASQAVMAQNGDVKTETITVKDGEPGPPGRQARRANPGGQACPDGFVNGRL